MARATSFAELGALMAKMFDPEAAKAAKPLDIRPTDVVITPYAKSGTTWLQQMVHTLRTGGDMDFDDISRVVPWIETSPMLGIDINAEQRAEPRAFKSHLEYEKLPAGGKYINSVRHPGDVHYSHYKFMEGWFLEPGSITVDEYVRAQIKERNYWKHLISWWRVRQQPNVLFLCYENMLEDIEGTIRRVAEFIDVPLSEDLLARTREYVSIDFMKKHNDRFDDALMRKRSEEQCGLPPGSDSSKVRAGRKGDGQHISDSLLAELGVIWQEEVAGETGCADYESLRTRLS